MRVFIKIIILSIFFCACRSPDASPELSDPIYLGLQEKLVGFEKDLKFAEGEKERMLKHIEETHVHDITLKMKRKTYYINEKDYDKAVQQINFTKIAIENRKREVRLRYLEAYKLGKEDEWLRKNEVTAFESRMDNNSFLERQK